MNKLITTAALALILVTTPVLGSKRPSIDEVEQTSKRHLKRLQLAQTPDQELRNSKLYTVGKLPMHLSKLAMIPKDIDVCLFNCMPTQDLVNLHRTLFLIINKIDSSLETQEHQDSGNLRKVMTRLDNYWKTYHGHARKIFHIISQIPAYEGQDHKGFFQHYSQEFVKLLESGQITKSDIRHFERLKHIQSLSHEEAQDLTGHDKWAYENLPREVPCLQFTGNIEVNELLFNYNELRYLNPTIGRFTNLQDLDLEGNKLQELPPEIGQLAGLQYLNLLGNQLTNLPREILQLTRLHTLYLSCNHLRELPPEISLFTNLDFLGFSNMEITSLPREICHLTNLDTIDLNTNRLKMLPPEFGQLTKLECIYLEGNQLEELPPEIVRLTNLQKLYLQYNKITSLPPMISQLTNLQYLDLEDNQLEELPPEIGQLAGIDTLGLKANQLKELPPEFGQLTSLSSLKLQGNRLTHLPREFGQLTNLQDLNLEGNQLEELPPEFRQLTNLQYLNLEGNQFEWIIFQYTQDTPLEELPQAVLELKKLLGTDPFSIIKFDEDADDRILLEQMKANNPDLSIKLN